MKYDTLELDVMSDSPYLDEDELARVNSFLQGIFDADKQLGRLADFVESRDTPTIIVFFGDHLPILGLHTDMIFEQLSWISNQAGYLWDLHDRTRIFQTPYLVWANYDLGQEDWGALSTYMLAARVAEASGINMNRYFTYLLGLAGHFRGITNELYIDIHGEFHPSRDNRNNPHILALEALWYAKFFGDDEMRDSLAEILE